MGGVSPVLYRPVVPARLVKTSADVKFSAPAEVFIIFWEKSKILCPITAPKIRTRSQLLSKFSHYTHKLLNGGRPRLWARLPGSGYNPVGWGGCGEGGAEMRRGQAASVITSGWGEGGGLATVCTPHICSPLSRPSFSFLHSAVEASFDIKKACEKPHKRLDFYSVLPLEPVIAVSHNLIILVA
jgi:hypothetical protein